MWGNEHGTVYRFYHPFRMGNSPGNTLNCTSVSMPDRKSPLPVPFSKSILMLAVYYRLNFSSLAQLYEIQENIKIDVA